jgi:hypothetical protein
MKSPDQQRHSRLTKAAHIPEPAKMPYIVVIDSTCLSPRLLLWVFVVAGFPFADRNA